MRTGSALCLLPSVSFFLSLFLFLSPLSTVDGTDNRSLPGDLALKHYPSCWQQYSSRVLKWRKYHVLHIDKLLFQAPLHLFFLVVPHLFLLVLTEQVLKKQVMSCHWKVASSIPDIEKEKSHFCRSDTTLNPCLFDRYWSITLLANNSRNTVIEVNRQLLAVSHPGSICPCKNKSAQIQVWTRGVGWDIWGRKDDTEVKGVIQILLQLMLVVAIPVSKFHFIIIYRFSMYTVFAISKN